MNGLELKKLLAENLQALVEHDAGRRAVRLTHEQIADKAAVGKGTVGRLARQESAPAVDTLEAIAGVFGLRAWQMLAGPLDPSQPFDLMTPEIREELAELRAVRAQLEEIARGGQGSFRPPSPRPSNTGDREDLGQEPSDPSSPRRGKAW